MMTKTSVKICMIIVFTAFVSLITSSVKSEAETIDPTIYYASSADEVATILKNARSKHISKTRISVDTSVVPIENELPNRGDVHSSIYNKLNYQYNPGLFNSYDYDVYTGPCLVWNLESFDWDKEADSNRPGNTIYTIEF
ncbi:MAG: hypothetical protein IJL75_03825, partial [Eubacterium sp.]|nr:hypothetical protein [Eubacterium sp.]